MELIESAFGFFTPVRDFYQYIVVTKRDPRTDDWLLVKSPGALLTILVTYIYFCTKAGPIYMKDRKPFNLKYALILYNALQIVFSIFLVYEGLAAGWMSTYKFKCQPIDYSDDPLALRMAGAVWWYYMAKLSELLDTVFFVLRKKNNQITFLHLYHHFMMPICGWIGIKYLPGGHSTLMGLINSSVHVVMYSYYFLASLGPQYQKYLWWKKHVTEMQMVQFCIVFVHHFQVLFRQCDYPKAINMLLATQSVFFFYLFGSFYFRAYWKNNSKVTVETIKDPKKKLQENNNTPNGKLKEN